MTVQIKHIEVPEEWKSTNDWNSHRPALWLALQNTTGPITEFGCGYGSTPLLQKYCQKNNRQFFSYETNKEWAQKFDNIRLIDNYDWLKVVTGLLFVDLAPGELRKEVIAKHVNNADVIVIHDSEISSSYVYNLEPTLCTFNYRIDYCPSGKPHTSIVSNFINLEEWKTKYGEN